MLILISSFGQRENCLFFSNICSAADFGLHRHSSITLLSLRKRCVLPNFKKKKKVSLDTGRLSCYLNYWPFLKTIFNELCGIISSDNLLVYSCIAKCILLLVFLFFFFLTSIFIVLERTFCQKSCNWWCLKYLCFLYLKMATNI